jgi:rubrerythrin
LKDDHYQAYVGDAPEPTCFVDDAIEVKYFIKALETRLKYCPDQKVCIVISAESTRRILKALKSAEVEKSVMPWNVLGKLDDGTYKGKCGNCGFVHYFIEGHDAQYRFCPQCGEQKVI